MPKYIWEVQRAVVEEEIYFPTEVDFENYIRNLDWRDEPYKVVSKELREGRLYVIMRKRYGEYPFLGEQDESTLSPLMKLMKDKHK